MSSEVAIKVENLSKCYQIYEQPRDRLKQFVLPRLQRAVGLESKQYFREFWALKDVSFEVRKGETVGIIGRNGSGKSTLLQMICGTLNPTGGNVQTNGRVAALLELGSGFNPEFTGRENVYLNGSVLGLAKAEIDARFDQIVNFADIGDFIEQPVKTYSSGMLVRLAFAVIAHVDADILVIDEALAVGDAFFSQKCMRFLRNFMQNGTVLFVSHDANSVKSLCNRVIWLGNGRIIESGAPKHVCELYMEALYEAQQGKSRERMVPTSVTKEKADQAWADQRLKFINASNLRNDLEIFKFDAECNSFGIGGGRITDVVILDSDGTPLTYVVGGEVVTVRITAKLFQDFDSPIIGFNVRDNLGQVLFGDNTYLSSLQEGVVSFQEGEEICADFNFRMPLLRIGDYSICVALANGSQQYHVQHHWMHDAILIRSESTSVATGLVGIPMLNISVKALETAR